MNDAGYAARRLHNVRSAVLRGVVDSCAAKLVLPASTAEQLGVPTMGEATVRYADQRTATRPVVEEVRLEEAL